MDEWKNQKIDQEYWDGGRLKEGVQDRRECDSMTTG